MKGNRAVATAVVVILVVILGAWLLRRSSGGGSTNLLDQFETATKAPASAEFPVSDVKLNDLTMKAVHVPGGAGSRLVWKVRIPDHGWLRVHVGMAPESWTQPGDGVKFLVLVADGKSSDELFSQHVDPFNNPADRRWIPVMVDLSGYAGEEVSLIFNTYASVPDAPANADNDLPLWGEPEIITR